MRVREIFWSIQGEGARTGMPSIFLRLGGCTLQCPYCDSRETWTSGEPMTTADIRKKIAALKKSFPRSQVVITGGEPLEQDLGDLVRQLRNEGHFIAIETNGIYYQPIEIDWWTVSPKDVGEFYIAKDLHPLISEIKLVATAELDLAVVGRMRAIGPDFPIFLQPDWTDPDRYAASFSLYKQCQNEGIAGVRLGLQAHKIYGVE